MSVVGWRLAVVGWRLAVGGPQLLVGGWQRQGRSASQDCLDMANRLGFRAYCSGGGLLQGSLSLTMPTRHRFARRHLRFVNIPGQGHGRLQFAGRPKTCLASPRGDDRIFLLQDFTALGTTGCVVAPRLCTTKSGKEAEVLLSKSCRSEKRALRKKGTGDREWGRKSISSG